MSLAAPASPAVAAFLRGVERRAALLAELQCGDQAAGDAALGVAMRAFRQAATRHPMGQWPRAFWGLLLATPQLRRRPRPGSGPLSWRPLATLGNGPRAALLLRLLAGLEGEEAAAVLGVSPEACREAVRRALQGTAEGRTEADTWSDWEGAFQYALKSLPAVRLAQLARLRTLALGDIEVEPMPGGAARPARPRPRALRGLAWSGVVLCTAALVASFVRPQWFAPGGPPGDRIRTTPLAAAQAPGARFDADLAAWSHRDFDLLADPDGLRDAQRLPLLAWYAAQQAAQAAPPAPIIDAALAAPAPGDPSAAAGTPAIALPATGAGTGAAPAEAEAAIARLPAAAQAGVRAQARRWAAWSEAERQAYRQRQARWDAQPPAVRGAQRERYLAWRGLDPVARSQVADAARALAALPAEEREGMRTRFIAQDASAQRGWLLGPLVGASYPRLQPLVAQQPPARRAALLELLRRLTPAEMDDLSRLAQRTPPQERPALLQGLLSTSDANRAAWLQARAAR